MENPFDDIVPRITVAEKKAQALARAEARREAEAREKRSKAKKWVTWVLQDDIDLMKITRNTGLLSFGEAEEVKDESANKRKKDMGRPDREPSDVHHTSCRLTGQKCLKPWRVQLQAQNQHSRTLTCRHHCKISVRAVRKRGRRRYAQVPRQIVTDAQSVGRPKGNPSAA